MYNVTVIATRHNELGKCNSDELHKIIESLRPDVIFEELPVDLFDRYYKGNEFLDESLEVKTVKRYLLSHNIKHIPVDIDISHDLSTNDIDYMFNTFKRYDVYKKLEDELDRMTGLEGFGFLNSKKCSDLFEQKKITEINLMAFMPNKNILLRTHKLFYKEQDNRELEIIKNIYNYSKENKYNQALLFIGSAHRKSIFEKIEKYKSPDNIKLFWALYEN